MPWRDLLVFSLPPKQNANLKETHTAITSLVDGSTTLSTTLSTTASTVSQ